jgi:hypothetical protein
MELLIGIDWSQDHHDIRVLNPAGPSLVRFRIAHSPEGFAQFHAKVSRSMCLRRVVWSCWRQPTAC